MGIWLAFAPFIAFAIVDRVVGSVEGLLAGAVVAIGLLVFDWIRPGRVLKILDVGTALLFCGLGIYALRFGPEWSIVAVRLLVDSGLLAIVLLSIAVGKPFTFQYAREQVAPEVWGTREFYRTNVVISLAWALAFAVLVVAELILLYRPDIPPRVGVIAMVGAIVGAMKFTAWYPRHGRVEP